MTPTATQFITQTYQQPYRPSRLNAVANDPYNDFIWALALKFTNTPEEAKAAVEEMQADIKRCAEKGVGIKSNEDRLVARIAWRRLLKFLQ